MDFSNKSGKTIGVRVGQPKLEVGMRADLDESTHTRSRNIIYTTIKSTDNIFFME